MPNLIVKIQCTNEWMEGFDFAYLPITKDLAQKVMARRKTFLAAFKKDDALSDMQFWDYSVNYFDHDSEKFPELDESQGGTRDYMEVNADFNLENVEVQGTECDMMVVGERGVYWSCFPKHVDNCKITTMEIPYSVFEEAL